jgi:hypothetical protein
VNAVSLTLVLSVMYCASALGSTDSAQSEQSSSKGKDEVPPESVAEAFVRAYSGIDVDAVADLYAGRVDYTNGGVIGNSPIRKQAQEYFQRWPVRLWSLVGPVNATSTGPSRQKIVFSANYDTCNPQTNKHASGIALTRRDRTTLAWRRPKLSTKPVHAMRQRASAT